MYTTRCRLASDWGEWKRDLHEPKPNLIRCMYSEKARLDTILTAFIISPF